MPRIDDYELIAKLGEGGMGAVYKARQLSLDRIVALKVLAPKLAQDQSFVSRFLREARATAKLNHPNIVAGIGVGSADGYHYFAMEFIEGGTLKTLIQARGSLPEEEVLRIGAAVASALAHAHAVGIVHRDVKPDNIMIDRDGTPKLADLGLAKGESAEDASLTQAGMVVGTPHYMAPEQAACQVEVDGRADTYALGCTLYHAATGKTPYEAPSTAVLMVKHLQEKMAHPQSVKPGLSNDFCLILSRMVAQDREDRYADLKEAAADMEALLNGREPSCKPLPPTKSKFQPPPGGPKFERRTGKHAPIEGERRSGRHAPVESESRAESRGRVGQTQRSTSKTRPVAKPQSNAVLMAVGAGVVVLGAILFFALSGGSKNQAQAQPAPGPGPTPKTPQPAPGPAAISPAPLPKAIPAPAPDPVAAPPIAIPTGTEPPLPRDLTPLLQNDSLTGKWNNQKGDWSAANGVITGKAPADNNASLWKYGCLPVDFDLSFEAEHGAQGYHFGWNCGDGKTTCFVHIDGSGVDLSAHLLSNKIVLGHAAPIKPGKHTWRIIGHQNSVQIWLDGVQPFDVQKVETVPGIKRDLCFYSAPGGTVRYSKLQWGTPPDSK